VRAIGLELPSRNGLAQVSVNVEEPASGPAATPAPTLAAVVAAVRAHAPVAAGELVGLAPRAALEGFPADVPLPGFDPGRHLIENALGL
jgi:glutamate formiminotransferase/glutamate formiminotransferase/formiminotetrahydrofolate cyclodeaminase